MILRFTLTHPDSPKSINAGGAGARRHWSAAHAEKKRWTQIYTTLLLAAKVPRGMEFCRTEATIRFGRQNGAETHNYLDSVVKPLADVLAPPPYLYPSRGRAGRLTIPNTAPRWLPDDADKYFKFDGVTFEYPKPWPFTDPRVKSEIVIRLEAHYPDPSALETSTSV